MLLSTLLDSPETIFDLVLVDQSTVLLTAHMRNTPLIISYQLPRPVDFEVERFYIHKPISNKAIKSILLGSFLILKENLSELDMSDLGIDATLLTSNTESCAIHINELNNLLKLIQYPRYKVLKESNYHITMVDKIVFHRLYENRYSASYITTSEAITTTVYISFSHNLPETFELRVNFLLLLKNNIRGTNEEYRYFHPSTMKTFYFEDDITNIRVIQMNTVNAPFRTPEGQYIPELYDLLYGDVYNNKNNYGNCIEITFKLKDLLKALLVVKRFQKSRNATYSDYVFIKSDGGKNLVISGEEHLPTSAKNIEIPINYLSDSTNFTYASCIDVQALLGFLDAVKGFDKNLELTVMLFDATKEMYADDLTTRRCFFHLPILKYGNTINYTPTTCYAHFAWLLDKKGV